MDIVQGDNTKTALPPRGHHKRRRGAQHKSVVTARRRAGLGALAGVADDIGGADMGSSRQKIRRQQAARICGAAACSRS